MMKKELKRTQDDPVPLYFKLINQMRREILVQLKPGDPIPSERVLSQHFHICRTTVRQALEQLTVNGEIYKLHGKGTFKSFNQTNNIKELVYVIYNSAMICSPGREITIRALAETAEKRGYHLVIRGFHSAAEKSGLRDFAKQNINGGLLVSVQELSNADVLSLQQTRIPCVFMNQDKGYAVRLDYQTAGCLAAQWCIKRQFRRIALFLPSRTLPDIRNFQQGFTDNLTPEIKILQTLETGYDRAAAATAAKWLLSNKKGLDAVICADDMIAAGVADALAEKKLSNRIQVCGINNSYLAAELQFSSVDLNLAERARQAAGLLADLLEGKAPPAPHIIRIKPKFIERTEK